MSEWLWCLFSGIAIVLAYFIGGLSVRVEAHDSRVFSGMGCLAPAIGMGLMVIGIVKTVAR